MNQGLPEKKGWVEMEALLTAVVDAVNMVLWDYLLIYALLGIGLFFTVYLGAPQLSQFATAMKTVFGGLFRQKNPADKDQKSLSQFQALAVAISAQIGTGNVAGVATAITAGGPGAIFWMWLSAVLGMATIFSEAVLAQKYRVVSNGKYIGGPAFYIIHGLGPKIGRSPARLLAGIFSVAIILALGVIGNADVRRVGCVVLGAVYGGGLYFVCAGDSVSIFQPYSADDSAYFCGGLRPGGNRRRPGRYRYA